MPNKGAIPNPRPLPSDPFPEPTRPPDPPEQTPEDPVNVPPPGQDIIFPDGEEPLGIPPSPNIQPLSEPPNVF